MSVKLSAGLIFMLVSIAVFAGCVEEEPIVEGFSILDIVFCSESPMGYMNYTEQPNAIYNRGLNVWIYINVLNEEYNLNPDESSEMWLMVDITVKSPNGTVVPVPGCPADYHENFSKAVDPEKLFLQYYIPTAGNMSEGKYTIEVTVTDKLAGKTATTSSHFTLAKEFDISNIVFCSESPMGYMNYTEQPNAIYNRGLNVWIYINVLNEEYNLNPDESSEMWLMVDITVKSPNGTVVPVPGCPADYHENFSKAVDPEKLFLQYYIPTAGNMSEGKYTIEVTVTDKLAGKTATTSSHFTLARKYYNKDYNFSIEQPIGWFVEESDTGSVVIFFGPREGNFSVNILIMVFDAQNMTLDHFVSTVKQNDSQSLTNYQLIFEEGRIIGGLDSYELVVTHTVEELDLKLKEVILLENDKAYMIVYTALQSNYNEYLPAFETIIETFRIEL